MGVCGGGSRHTLSCCEKLGDAFLKNWAGQLQGVLKFTSIENNASQLIGASFTLTQSYFKWPNSVILSDLTN